MTDTDEPKQGSWTPLIIVFALLLLRWLADGQGNTPIRFRRWYNMKVRTRNIVQSHFETELIRCGFFRNIYYYFSIFPI
jgi:hypothetical protein